MQTHSPLRPSKNSKSRQFMRLPSKLLFISTFFNQKIQNTPEANQPPQDHPYPLPLPFSPNSPSTRKPRKYPSTTPKYQLNNSKIHFSFDEQQRPNRKLRAIKHHSFNIEDISSKVDLSSHRMGDTGKKITVFFGENDSFVIDTKRSALLGEDHHEIIKRQLQEKFHRTRLNFKEQQRVKELSQVKRAVERRHRLLKKITKSQQIGKKKSEGEMFEPWMRDKMTKDGVEMEESGNYEVEF